MRSIRLGLFAAALLVASGATAQEGATPAPDADPEALSPPRIVITPPPEGPIEPETAIGLLSDGRIVRFSDYVLATFVGPEADLADPSLIWDAQTGRLSRLVRGEAVGPEGVLVMDPQMMLAQLGPEFQGSDLNTIYASFGQYDNLPDLGLSDCATGFCPAGYKKDGRIAGLFDPESDLGSPFFGLYWLWTKLDGRDN